MRPNLVAFIQSLLVLKILILFVFNSVVGAKVSRYVESSSTLDGYNCDSLVEKTSDSKVGLRPTDVTDFECLGYDYKDFSCSFSQPVTAPNKTEYTLGYSAHAPVTFNNTTVYIQNFLHNMSCDIERFPKYVCKPMIYRVNYKIFNFTLTAINQVGTYVQKFSMNHHKMVVPETPKIIIENITDHSAVLSWEKYLHVTLQIKLELRPHNFEWHELKLQKNYRFIEESKDGARLELINLPYAYLLYEVRLRLKVKVACDNERMWSTPQIETFRTKSRPPDKPPVTDVGSFYIDKNEGLVRLYWQSLPTYEQNGPNFTYLVKEQQEDGKIIELTPVRKDDSSATFQRDSHKNYTYIVKSVNDAGESAESREIVVYADRKNRKPEWLRNLYNEINSTTISWRAPNDVTELVDYTVYWCSSKSEYTIPPECQGPLNFTHVSKDTRQFVLNATSKNEIYIIAISANYKDYNAGMFWALCKADATSELIKMEPTLSADSNSILVYWSLPPGFCPSLLEGYNLTYCRIAGIKSKRCVDGQITINVSKEEKKYLIKNLKPYSTYSVQIYMYSEVNQGKVSDVMLINTKEDAPSPPRNLSYHNVSSNSVWITWLPPENFNGQLRYYSIIYNREEHILNCSGAAAAFKGTMKYKLDKLSSFTNYTVYIVAHTIKSSERSNLIKLQTLIGIPSSPPRVEYDKNNPKLLTWSRPEFPSGRVECYEVEVTEWLKGSLKHVRQHISVVVGSTECITRFNCKYSDYQYKVQVRAVNVADRLSEVDSENIVLNNTKENADDEYLGENEDLKCISMTDLTGTLQKYHNTERYLLYKSKWKMGPDENCMPPVKVRIQYILIPATLIISGLGLAFLLVAFHYFCAEYKQMKDIKCVMPVGIAKEDVGGRNIEHTFDTATEKPIWEKIDHIEGIYEGNKSWKILGPVDEECLCNMELQKEGNVQVAATSPVTEISTTQITPTNKASTGDNYMVMNPTQLKLLKPTTTTTTLDGYVLPDESETPLLHQSAINCYVKPNSIVNWQPSSHQVPVSADSGYVPADLLEMTQPQSTAIPDNGYTSLASLMKPTTTTRSQNVNTAYVLPSSLLDCSNNTSRTRTLPLPPISGYVTQRELSVFGQQRNNNNGVWRAESNLQNESILDHNINT